jgi:hypothetical protein
VQDVGLDHDIVSTANQHKMFGIVTADEHDTSFASSWMDSITPTCRDALRPRSHLNISFSPLRDAGQNSSIAALTPILPERPITRNVSPQRTKTCTQLQVCA